MSLHVGAELNPGSLEEQVELLTAEPSLHLNLEVMSVDAHTHNLEQT